MSRVCPAMAVPALVVSFGLEAIGLAERVQKPADRPAAGKLAIHAVTTDRQGTPVMDLRPDELEVRIGVYRVPIDRLTPGTSGERGRTIVLLLDDLTLPPDMSPNVKAVGQRFITRMTPGDRMGLAMLDRREMEITEDPVRVRRMLDGYSGGRGSMADRLGEYVLESVTAISRRLAELPGRKVIVAIGAAWLFDGPIRPGPMGMDLRREWVEAIRTLAFANTHVYVVDPGGVGSGQSSTPSSGFARETGGRAFTNTNDFDGVVAQILREIDNYYVIEMADPPIYRSSDLRELDVRITRRGVTVRAQRWIPGADRR